MDAAPGSRPRRTTYSRPLSSYALSSWVLVPVAVLLGALVAFQFFHLTPRYVKLVFAALFFLAVLRLPFHLSMAMFLILFPAPTFVFFGDTNVIFLGVMSIIWYVRVRMGVLPRRVPSPIDWAVLFYLFCHLVSFINITSPLNLNGALSNMQFMVAGTVMFFLLYQAIRTEKQLVTALHALCWTAAFVDVTAIAEYYFGVRLIPRWFIFAPATTSWFIQWGRAGGVFGFHGLLADFSAMMFYLQVILGMRTRRRGLKAAYYLLAALSVLMIINSANRGGAVIWIIGGIYFVWLHRHRVRWPKFLLAGPIIFAIIASAGVFNDKLLSKIVVVTRLMQTQFVRGIPENRVDAWANMMGRVPEHLLFGHGPYIDLRRGVSGELNWPHNAYLFYLYTVGIIGLFSFLWILGKVIWISRPRGTTEFVHGSVAHMAKVLFHINVVMFALAQMRDEHQRGNVYIYVMWIVITLALIGTRLEREERQRREQERGRAPGRLRA